MKTLITTIAAVLVVGCGPSVDIHKAAGTGNMEAVKQHIAAGTDLNAKDEDGATPLHVAAGVGNNEIAELLIAKGADMEAKNKYGYTPLHVAAVVGNKETTELLINNGADLNAKLEEGDTPLDWAIHFKHSETADLIRKHGGKSGTEDSIHLAAAVGNIEAVKQHIAAGTDVNAKDKHGLTPLHVAATFGHKEVAELLIAAGADVNTKDGDGDTSLDWAETVIELRSLGDNVKAAKKETADLLRKHGGKTAEELKAAELVFEAAETRDIEVIKQILASTEGKWILKAIGKEQGQEFNDAGTVINKWNESKSELLMESKINRGERIIELVDIIKIDKGRILMDRGSHQLIGKWNSNEKTIVWNNKSGDFVFTGSSDFSEKQNIKEVFSIYRDGTQVFSVTADLKAEDK
jgi:ankyrin repeat protein